LDDRSDNRNDNRNLCNSDDSSDYNCPNDGIKKYPKRCSRAEEPMCIEEDIKESDDDTNDGSVLAIINIVDEG